MAAVPPRATDTDILILIAPLSGDPDLIQTNRAVGAFHGEDFSAARICEPLNFDFSKDTRTAEDEVKHRGAALIKKYHADLVVFGDVSRPNESIQLWMVNENGGCDPHPTKVILDHGFPPPSIGLDSKLKDQLLTTSVAVMAAACNHDQSTDWTAFALKVRKVGEYIRRSGNSITHDQFVNVTAAYSDAMYLLYEAGQGDEWFFTASKFNLDQANRVYGQKPEGRAYWLFAQANLIITRWNKTHNRTDIETAIGELDEAIRLYPTAPYFARRGSYYSAIDDNARAVDDLNAAIRLNSQDEGLYVERGIVWRAKGENERAIADFESAIRLNSKYATAYSMLAWTWHIVGDEDRSIATYDEAIRLAPQNERNYVGRAEVWRSKGDDDRAMADFDMALQLNPKYARAYIGRGSLWLLKSKYGRAMEDYDEAIRQEPKEMDGRFSRGIAQFAMGRFDAAASDFDESCRLDPKNAYAHIWRNLSKSRGGYLAVATKELITSSAALNKEEWPGPVIELLLGRRDPDATIKAVDMPNADAHAKNLCEAHFYVGEYHLLKNRPNEARAMLSLTRKGCPKNIDELAGTVAELKRLQH